MRFVSAAILTAALAVATGFAADQKRKDDVNQIGDRNVGKCVNFYSIEKEIALGKQLSEEVSRQAKLDRDPIGVSHQARARETTGAVHQLAGEPDVAAQRMRPRRSRLIA